MPPTQDGPDLPAPPPPPAPGVGGIDRARSSVRMLRRCDCPRSSRAHESFALWPAFLADLAPARLVGEAFELGVPCGRSLARGGALRGGGGGGRCVRGRRRGRRWWGA